MSRALLRGFTTALAMALSLTGPTGAGAPQTLPLRRIADLPLPGSATRLDYQSLDERRHRLFIAHLGDSEVIAVDTRSRRVVGTIPAISAVHGVLAVRALNRLYASATGTDEVVAIDEVSLRVVARVPAGVYPDGMAFDPVHGRLFVSDERGHSETVIDIRSNRRIATIQLGGEAGNSQYDPASGHIFVNVQTLGELVEIDPSNDTIVRRVSLSGADCIGNHGLLLDVSLRRGFIACEDNAKLVWLDMRAMHVVRTWTIGQNPDVLALDPEKHRLYVASESGVVSVFSDEANVTPIAQAFFASTAHTVAVDPLTHVLFFPLENVGGNPVLRIAKPR